MVVSGEEESLVYGLRLSSVGPAKAVGQDVTYEPIGVDLAMKLHYLKGIYFYDADAYRDLRVQQIKSATFVLFNDYYATCGRFRRSDSGRPYIKCNDCGARFIEAHCANTMDEWLDLAAHDSSLHKLLVSQQVIGPELHFSPPIYMQLTKFKCGGISIGLSWAHVLGDAFAASDFMNRLNQLLTGNSPIKAIKPASNPPPPSPPSAVGQPLSVKRVESAGDYWLPTNICSMQTFSFNLSTTQLAKLQTQVSNQTGAEKIPVFESICAVLWQLIAKVRKGPEPKTVTLCKHDPAKWKRKILSNSQIVSTVEAEDSVSDADPRELAKLLVAHGAQDEREVIEEAVERENGVSDFVFYGANLTFVNWEETNFYGRGMGFEKPRFVWYSVLGVADEGAVLVFPGPGENGGERFVTVTLPEKEVVGLRAELTAKGLLLEPHVE